VDYALETTAFYWIVCHHNPLKWHRTSYSCLFLNFGMHGIYKMFTTKVGLVSLCRLSQRMSMGVPSAINPNKSDYHWKKWISYEGVFRERFSGRKIELDEVIEPEQDEQSSATPENFLEAATAFMALTRLQRIYNFWCSMLVFTPFAYCFVTLRGTFMHFPELTY
jgi:hypothetical protein